MTQYKLSAPKKLDATVALPASKSISNRALIIYALSGGHIMPQNLSDCDDTEVIINAIRYMPDVIDIKAAGTAMRFMTAYLSLMRGTHTLTGTERMKKRPIKILVDALRSLGAEISYLEEEGFPPLSITGTKLTGSVLEMSGSVSSQYISAVLMIGPMLDKGFELRLTGDIISRPYIDLTLYMMNEFGADADWTSADTITIKPVPYKTREYLIENDWSGASYWYEMMALMDNPDAKLMLTGLKDGSKQGDSVARYIFSMLGVKTVFESKTSRKPQTVTITANGRCLPRLEYDFINSPDLAQTFVVTCAAKGVRFHFKGLSTLKIKETDRIEALKKEMRKLGYVIESRNDSELIWDGETCEPQMEKGIDTYEDHRMALAFAPYALKSGEIIINNPQVVTKSYPHFWESLEEVGFKIEVIEQ
ncbi:MAG: 3-phosphoshikimate 1-carboxyvinyltransferase [Prevotella sp.]|jgi:3-phosphoshikimate 1-carboxyvinyltransferase|nr:3-phosphoshikimate 1-carboxyvinyltransferase [Prevotella sp.]